MQERQDVPAEELAAAVAELAGGDFRSIECDQQKNGLWRLRAWPEAAMDDEAE